MRKTESSSERGEEKKRGKSGEKKTRTERRIGKKWESTKWFYLQIRGWSGKTRWCIGIKSGGGGGGFHYISVCCGVYVRVCSCRTQAGYSPQ